jgi:IclR family acetate operon transcriptional repressor
VNLHYGPFLFAGRKEMLHNMQLILVVTHPILSALPVEVKDAVGGYRPAYECGKGMLMKFQPFHDVSASVNRYISGLRDMQYLQIRMTEAGAKPQSPINDRPLNQSLDRGLQILEQVGRSSAPVSLGQLTAMLGIDRSSAFRLANTLKRRGFLAHPSVGKDYVLGTSVWGLSLQYNWSGMLAEVARPHLYALAEATEESAHLAIRQGRRALFIDHVVSTNHLVAISGQTGEFVPLYCTSYGKALLADFNEARLKRLLGSKPLAKYARNTIKTAADLAVSCAQIRASGFASDYSEYIDGLRSLAAPVRDKEGAVIASIGISVPANRFPVERQSDIAAHVTQIAVKISAFL